MADIQNQITTSYGKDYLQTRKYKNKNESAQEAHEAIRPTYMENASVEDADCRRLYELIWKRTMASQMSDAELEKTVAKIKISTNGEDLSAQGEVLKFDGFLKVYMEDRDEEELAMKTTPRACCRRFKRGNNSNLKKCVQQKGTRPYPGTASLVKKLKNSNRPPIYLRTDDFHHTKRGYVEKRDKEGIKDFRYCYCKTTRSKSHRAGNDGAEKSNCFQQTLPGGDGFLKMYLSWIWLHRADRI